MKRTTIAPAFLLLGTLLVGGLSAAGPSNASQTSKPSATAAHPGSSPSANVASASSHAAQPHAVAANPASSTQPKASDAERAKKRDEVLTQVKAVLTDEQAQQLDTKVKGGEKMRKALSELNLTSEQKTKIKAILKAAYPREQNQSQRRSK